MKILAGDIGGTNARLAVFTVEEKRYRLEIEEVFPSRKFSSLEEIVRTFAASHGLKCRTACFGVPGPVTDGRAEITNLPWVVQATRMAAAVDVAQVAVINDLEAQAWGIAALGPADWVVLNEGDIDARGNAALLSAGTGLGQAGLYWDGFLHRPFACEGGHSSFAPRGNLQTALLEFLTRRLGGHVSWERVLSGPGLLNIHEFLSEYRQVGSAADHVEMIGKEGPATITGAAMAGNCPLCVEALDLFVELYGAEAGNLALKLMGTGGIYLGGGIAPRIVEKLTGPAFQNAFLDKGRMRHLLASIPVRVIMREGTAVLGAARYAVLMESP